MTKKLYSLRFPQSLYPCPSEIEQAVCRNWFMFNAYSDNPLLIQSYIRFINGLFDNVLDDLNVGIVEYEYTDEENKLDEINVKYGLEQDEALTSLMELIVESSDNYTLGKKIEFMGNEFTYYDPSNGISDTDVMIDLLDDKLIGFLLKFVRYIREPKLQGLLMDLLVVTVSLGNNTEEFCAPLFEQDLAFLYESKYIDSVYLRMINFRKYVYTSLIPAMGERRELF